MASILERLEKKPIPKQRQGVSIAIPGQGKSMREHFEEMFPEAIQAIKRMADFLARSF